MKANEQLNVLLRIASALERIAAVLEGKRATTGAPVLTPPKPRPTKVVAVKVPPTPQAPVKVVAVKVPPTPQAPVKVVAVKVPPTPQTPVKSLAKAAPVSSASSADMTIQKELVAYLQSRDFKTHGLKYHDESETYNLAKQIWASRNISFPFLKALRHNLAERARFDFPYRTYSEVDQSRMRSLGDVLDKKDIIDFHDDHGIFVVTPKVGNAKQHYITGFWGEEITLYLIRKVMMEVSTRQKMKHKIFQNVTMTRLGQDGKTLIRAEIDAVLMVNQTFFFFEVKTGNILKKYDEMAHRLAGDKHYFIMCCLDRVKGLAKLRETDRIKVFQLDALEQSLQALLESSQR